jgi:hypothetical protein
LVTATGVSLQPRRQRVVNQKSSICFIWVRLKLYATQKSVPMQIHMTAGGRNIFLNVQLKLIILLSHRRLVVNRTTGSPLRRGWFLKGLSRMTVTSHVRFLGGLGSAMTPGYPVRLIFGFCHMISQPI